MSRKPFHAVYLTTVLIAAIVIGACAPQAGTPAFRTDPTAAPTTAAAAVPANFTPVSIGQGPCVGVRDVAQNITKGPGSYTRPQQVITPGKTYCAIITMEKGRIVIQLYPEVAPQHVNSFVFLAQQGYFDGLTFHRVIPDFVAQGGDPTGTGTGGPGYTLPLEVNPAVKYDRPGVLGMARTNDPNSAGSQFFITYGTLPNLDPGPAGEGYTIFGQVVEGYDVVRAITPRDPQRASTPGDKMLRVRIVEK
jgi:peptidylprolyl isomerase